MQIRHIPLGDLTEDADNPNEMTAKQRAQLYESLSKYGMVQPLVVDHKHKVINGNQKLLVIKMHDDLAAKYKKVPCYITPPDMSPEDKMLLQQALNKVHGQHDLTKDSAIFERLIQQERGADLATLLGKKPDTISKLIQRTKDAADGITSHDQTTGKCRIGETWALGRHIIHVGDCQTYHKEAQKEPITLMLTDPPYGISVVKDGAGVGNYSTQIGTRDMVRARYKPVAGDDKPFDPQALLNLKADTKIIFGAHAYCDKLPSGTQWLCWVKKPVDQFQKFSTSDCELAWTSRKGGGVHGYYQLWNGMMHSGKDGRNRVHPTQKPVELLRDMIQDYSKEGDLIYDPYLGSGSTLMACEISNRTCIGVELSPEYCELVINRWESHTKQKAEKVKSV